LGGTPFDRAEYEKVIVLGGLHVIGTERHESRRIDNQLRGRAGRQGDAGSSQFYVSMEDSLMRIFGGDRMKSLMKTMQLPEDTPIDNGIISKSIESAQKKVEGNNFDIRKHLVEYDDVINKHREAIYERRLRILKLSDNQNQAETEDSLAKVILEMVEDEINDVVTAHTAADDPAAWNFKEIAETMATIYPGAEKIKLEMEQFSQSENLKLDRVMIRTKLIDQLMVLAEDYYQSMVAATKQFGVAWSEIEKSVLLHSIDTLWIEHLETIDQLRRGIGLRGYGQRDPLVEYKKEAFKMYSELNALIQKQVVYSIYKVGAVTQSFVDNTEQTNLQYSAPAKEMSDESIFAEAGAVVTGAFGEPKIKDKNDEGEKIGRNDLCHCGSGKKYKKCHGA
jgi:preprotein translocase subunit SecA